MNAVILSGGRGTRIGNHEKGFLALGGETFISLKIKLLRRFFKNIIVVTNNPFLYARLGTEIIKDEKEGFGPIMGIYTGLKNSAAGYNFFTTSDTPFLKAGIIKCLIDNTGGFDAVVPRYNGDIEPLCAVYSKKCLGQIEKAMAQKKIRTFFQYVKTKFIPEAAIEEIDPGGLSFFNVNTNKDYKQARKIYRTGLKKYGRGVRPQNITSAVYRRKAFCRPRGFRASFS